MAVILVVFWCRILRPLSVLPHTTRPRLGRQAESERPPTNRGPFATVKGHHRRVLGSATPSPRRRQHHQNTYTIASDDESSGNVKFTVVPGGVEVPVAVRVAGLHAFTVLPVVVRTSRCLRRAGRPGPSSRGSFHDGVTSRSQDDCGSLRLAVFVICFPSVYADILPVRRRSVKSGGAESHTNCSARTLDGQSDVVLRYT